MGRAKVVMELIKNDKKRNITFKRRKQGIIKKALELTTLCDVNVSMIVCTDKDQQPEIFPPDSHKLIDLYKTKCITEPEKVRSCNLSDFIVNRDMKIEEEDAKANKKKLEFAEYPTWFDFLNDYSEGKLREFALGLDGKIDHVRNKIESLKKTPAKIDDQNLDDHYPDTFHHQVGTSLIMMPSLMNPVIPMDYYDNDLLFDAADQYNLMNKQPSNLVMNEDDNNGLYDLEGLINIIQPPPPPPAMNNKPFLVSNFGSQMMEYNNFGYCPTCGDHQHGFFVNQPSNPGSLSDGNKCCNHDQVATIQPPQVVYSFPPPPPQIVQQPEAPYMNPFFKSA